ncbi:DUF5801 repeats-in-toxin domain-containing protein [Aliarcobacter cryaerophilus]|uniref:DUF5801 repeats-in-toxin domain-containing protein n=1 Tax=Aliarcobacter cryaerophilus TaxID=28198 RepID=UPI00112F6424|nr:DUF5801 repeats-in-toxin domain-containing protein [Aliarcobacter cryaerophilus]
MANLAQIQSIAQGQFFVKDSLGNLTELKVGDTVSLNDTIVAASSNTDLSKIEILFDTNELITLSQGEQLLDTTLLASTFGNEELAFDKQEVDETLNAWNNTEAGDETDMETAAGDVTEQATNAGDERAADGGALRSKFNSRDGDATDIVSDLREASWTGGIERTIEDSENMLLEDPLPVVYTIIEGINVVNEGDSANYVVKLQDAAGNPVIATQDTIIYVRYTNKTTQDGDTQYNNENIIEVVIKAGTSQTEFTIKTNDDYLADNGERFNLEITGNNSTEFDMRTGNQTGGQTNVDTTILDNSKDTPNDPYDQTTTPPVEGDLDTITIKLFALDKDGNRVPANEVAEGSPASYVAVAFDKNGVELTLNETVEVTFGKTGDSATAGGVDYDSTTQTVTLGKPFSTNTVDDYLADNGEKYSVQITDKTLSNASKYETVVIDTTSVTTTILDNSKDTPNDPYDQTTTPPVEGDLDTITIKLFALDKDGNRVPANEVAEGSPASYVAVAFDKNGVELTLNETVEVTFGKTGDSATAGGVDYDSTTQTVTLGKPFSTNTVDDYLADNGEKYSVQITDKTLSNASKYETVVIDTTSVTTTIKDNPSKVEQPDTGTGNDDPINGSYGKEDTVYVKIEGNPTVVEGGKLSHTVTLVDKDGNPVTIPARESVTVTLTYKEPTNDKNPNADDYVTKTVTVTIQGGTSSTTFENITKVDFVTEGEEVYEITISKVEQSGAFENVVIDSTANKVTDTILDGITLGKPVDSKVDEDNFYQNDLDGTNGQSVTKTNLTASESLGITIPNDYENTVGTYTINFVGNPTLDGVTKLTSDGKDVHFQTIGNKIIGYIGKDVGNGAVNTNNKVFEIVLNKSTGKYNYTQYKNIDHPKSGNVNEANGKENYNDNDNIDLNFKFNITTTSKNGQTVTSDPQDFKVTVNDSTPIAGEQNLVVYEDNSLQFIISDGGFKGNTIEISNDGGNTYKPLTTSSKNGENSIDILENGQKIGTLTNKGDGKLEFKPAEDYSKYTNDNLPNFKYQVSDTDGDYAEGKVNIKVKPVADAPTVTVKNIETTEDYNNTQEGTNKVALELKVPSLSKDQTDKNNATGDSPERNGEITLSFTNGGSLVSKAENKNIPNTGAKLFYTKDNGDITEIENFLINSNKNLKVVIVETSGLKDIDTKYHYDGLNPTAGKNEKVVYLTQKEYESLKIQHAEDNDTDIKFTINVKSYEVDDSGKPLNASDSTYADKTNSNLSKTTTANMTVIIKPVTDDIELTFDNATVNGETLGTKSDNKKTFTYKNIDEGNKAIDLQALLSKTSGALNGIGGTKADLDGSEIRTYKISDIPAGTVIVLDGKSYTVQDGKTSIEIPFPSNTKADPNFSMKFPENFSGEVKATITLSVIDKGVEAGQTDQTNYGFKDTNGNPLLGVKQAEVNFKVNVNPVADDATVKVGQPVGYEDAGRSQGNTSKIGADASKIDKPENGIRLPIEVTSTDKDGSETFTVTIKDIPNGSGLFVYDNSTKTYKLVEVSKDGKITIDGQAVTENKSGNISVKEENGKFAVEIKDYQNTEQPKFIPPHNAHGDFDLKVDAKTVDTVIIGENPVTSENTTAIDKPIKVVVKDVADSVVGNDYNKENLSLADGTNKDYNLVTQEDTQIKLDSVFKDSTKLSSYDKESEDLTIILKSLPKGVELEGNVTLINGQYIFKASDISSIKIVTPANYSGELNFDITYITTEKGEANNPSKTFDSKTTTDSVSIFVKPTVDAGFNSNTTKAEDVVTVNGKSYYKLDLGISHQNGDNDETLESVTIDKPTDGDFKLFIKKNSDGSFSEITDFTKTYTEAELKNIYVQAPENKHGSFDIKGTYTVKDSHYGATNSNYVATKTDDFKHTLNITPVTDTPTITVETGKDTIEVEAGENTEIKIPVKVSSEDTDGSENITKIVISGVPKDVTIDTGSAELDGKITVSEHNGIYTIVPKDGNYKLNDADFKNITINVTSGANFEHRDITITAFTKDAEGSKEEQTSTKITLDKKYNGNGGGTGTGPKLDIVVDETKKDFKATEDTQFNFLDVFKVVTVGGSDGRTELNFKIDVGSNATLKGLDAYKNTDGSYTIKGNRADIESVLANLKVVPNKDYNDNHTTDKSTLDITVTIDGKTPVIAKVPVVPVTDAMSIKVEATPTDLAGIVENKPVDLKITLINSVDGKHTEEIKSITIKVTETWKDNAIGEVTEKGLLTDTSGNYEINENLDGTYTITKKDETSFDFTEIKDLQYTPTTNRNGDVSFDVIVNHKEIDGKATMDTLENGSRNAIGSKVITVKPVVSSEIMIKDADKQNGIEDTRMASAKLTVEKYDPSEKFESVLIKVASGVAVYYDNGTKLAMNLGDGSWLVPVKSDGTLPEIFFKGKEHLGGEIDFTATINAKDGEAKVPSKPIKGSVTITEVADGVTIDPTKTGIDKNAFEWTTLNLNANMKDLDGSEKMYLELKGLGENSQFKLKDGGIVKSEYDSVNKVWTIKDIEFDKINDIQFTNDKNATVDIKAWTQDGIDSTREKPATGSMEIKYTDPAIESGKFTLGKEVNIDFSKIESGDIKDVSTIDLGAQGENKLLNLTLQDVLDMGKKDGSGNINLDILGGTDDKVSFAKDNGWELKTENKGKVEGDKTFDVYTNSGDSTVQVKVEQPISDGITN